MTILIWDTLEDGYVKDGDYYKAEYDSEQTVPKRYKNNSRFELVTRCDDSWASRERYRLEDHEYIKPVWHNEGWYKRREYVTNAYCHIKKKEDQRLVYYTENEAKGYKDIQAPIKPGAFLKKFYADVLDESEIKYWAEKHKEAYGTAPELYWARTPEEIEKVYSMDCSFQSCMQGPKTLWPDGIGHPARIYGAGDLAVAWVGTPGRLIARALVWEKKDKEGKVKPDSKVGRVYGDATKLRMALKDYGIMTFSDNYSFDFMTGARVQKIELPNILNEKGIIDHRREALKEGYPDFKNSTDSNILDIVCPYIDGDYTALKPNPKDKDTLLICATSDTEAIWVSENQEGFAWAPLRCPCCNGLMNQSEAVQIDIDEKGKLVTGQYCMDCYSSVGFYCEHTGKYFLKSRFTETKIYHKTICLEANKDNTFRSSISSNLFFTVERLIVGDFQFATGELNILPAHIIETARQTGIRIE